MGLGTINIRIDHHAYDRYCERVEPISYTELAMQVVRHMEQGYVRRDNFIQLDGVWWKAGKEDGIFVFYTCYGRTHFSIPDAVKWAKRNKDRIDLGAGNLGLLREGKP